MQYKQLDIPTLVPDERGYFEGYLAVFGNLDKNGDIIDRGAFAKTLASAREQKARNASLYLYPLLWQHDLHNPIGGITDAHEDNRGLFIKGRYDLNIELGRRAYSGAKEGYLTGLSIGYNVMRSALDAQGRRHLIEVTLMEGSQVTYPANPDAMLTSVKSAGNGHNTALSAEDYAAMDLLAGLIREEVKALLTEQNAPSKEQLDKAHEELKAQQRDIDALNFKREIAEDAYTLSLELKAQAIRNELGDEEIARRMQRMREQWASDQRALSEYRRAVKSCRRAHQTLPPHPLHDGGAWQNWRYSKQWLELQQQS